MALEVTPCDLESYVALGVQPGTWRATWHSGLNLALGGQVWHWGISNIANTHMTQRHTRHLIYHVALCTNHGTYLPETREDRKGIQFRAPSSSTTQKYHSITQHSTRTFEKNTGWVCTFLALGHNTVQNGVHSSTAAHYAISTVSVCAPIFYYYYYNSISFFQTGSMYTFINTLLHQ